MNEREKSLLRKALEPYQAVIKANNALPKDQRDHAAIAIAKDRIDRINGWMNVKPAALVTGAPPVLPEPPKREAQFTMTIHTVEELEKVFREIIFKNVDVSCPPPVQEAMRIMVKEFVRSEEWRFQKDQQPNCQFMGIDDRKDRWNCFLKINSTRRSKAEQEIMKRLRIKSFENWEKHDILIGTFR